MDAATFVPIDAAYLNDHITLSLRRLPIHIYSSESCLIPFWMYNNIITQLIIPKLVSTVGDFEINDCIHEWVLQFVGIIDIEEMSLILEKIRFRIGFLLKNWTPDLEFGAILVEPWIDVFIINPGIWRIDCAAIIAPHYPEINESFRFIYYQSFKPISRNINTSIQMEFNNPSKNIQFVDFIFILSEMASSNTNMVPKQSQIK